MSTLVVIPARYASTRFPGKPMAMLGEQTIISRVWQTLSRISCVDDTIVATDDERIFNHVNQVAGREAAMMTSTSHSSGTERCGEVVRRLAEQGKRYEIVINVQGDEPFVNEQQIFSLVNTFNECQTMIATLRTRILNTEELFSPNNVKVVCDDLGDALYFSRQPIPYRRGVNDDKWLEGVRYYKHVGIYAFRRQALLDVCKLKPAVLEECEKLEQLRWLSSGYRIAVRDTEHANIGIDTPEDLANAERYLNQLKVKS